MTSRALRTLIEEKPFVIVKADAGSFGGHGAEDPSSGRRVAPLVGEDAEQVQVVDDA